jgi:hypothetical protein
MERVKPIGAVAEWAPASARLRSPNEQKTQ